MFATPVELERHLHAVAAGIAVADRATVVATLDTYRRLANQAQAVVALAAARLAELGPPPEDGAANTEDWVAKRTGSTRPRAKERIATGNGLGTFDGLRAEALAGGLSPEQSAAILDALDQHPAAEGELLAAARRESLGELRERCARVKAKADPDPERTRARIRRKRRVRCWTDPEGARHLHAVGTNDEMAIVEQAIALRTEQRFEAARKAGVGEAHEAYAFDALVDLARGGEVTAPGRDLPLRHLILLRVDLEALVRGWVEGEETCEIGGLGPVPVDVVRGLLGDGIFRLVITRGTDVAHVTSLGRGPTAAQKIALLWQQPTCTREGCNRRIRLQVDHRDDWAKVLKTELHNLDPLCVPCHRLKTLRGWALVHGKGKRKMVPPGHPRHPRNTLPPADSPSASTAGAA